MTAAYKGGGRIIDAHLLSFRPGVGGSPLPGPVFNAAHAVEVACRNLRIGKGQPGDVVAAMREYGELLCKFDLSRLVWEEREVQGGD